MQRLATVMVSGLLLTACAAPAHQATAGSTKAAAGSKQVVLDGVQLTVPSSWPVVDGAHARNTCSSTFTGQANRVFIGVSYHGVLSCPPRDPRSTPSRADGVWMQPTRMAAPKETPTTLPSGQTVYLNADSQSSAVTIWYHHVMIQIGIGATSVAEKAILGSIEFHSKVPDTALLGKCPAPDPTPPTMPAPARLNTPLTLDDHNATMRPEPATVRPAVSAAAAWSRLFHDFGGGGFAGPLQWSITFGSYSAQTPATIHRNGSETAQYRGVPTWLVRGQGANTAYGPCGITVYAPVNAATGHLMGVETIG